MLFLFIRRCGSSRFFSSIRRFCCIPRFSFSISRFSITRSNSCALPGEFAAYAQKNPHGGMPFAVTGLNDDEYATLEQWLAQGAFRQDVPIEILVEGVEAFLMQTLALEGEKYNVRVNCLAPTAATRMTEDLMPPAVLSLLTPESVTPGVVFLASEDAPTRAILCAGAGGFATSHITLTEGTVVLEGADAAEQVAARFAQIDDRHDEIVPASGSAQSQSQLAKVMAARSLG